MKFTKFTSGAALATVLAPGVLSAPSSLESRQAAVTDLDVLQFALTVSAYPIYTLSRYINIAGTCR